MPFEELAGDQAAATLSSITPALVEQMIEQRQMVQVIKFRTTCTDCVPNY
jgi:hypothetical protein